MFEVWFNGTALGVLGIGLALCFLSAERLVELGCYCLWRRRLFPWRVTPTAGEPPINYIWLYLTGFVVSLFFTAIFISKSADAFGMQYPAVQRLDENDAYIRAWRLVTILWMEIFLLAHVSRAPRYKLGWALAWYGFSMLTVYLTSR